MDSQFVPLFCPDRYCPYKETGFYYLQSRYYDPTLGRFLNADSYASTGQGFLGYNMFAYCGNSPANASDPSGQIQEIYDWLGDGSGVPCTYSSYGGCSKAQGISSGSLNSIASLAAALVFAKALRKENGKIYTVYFLTDPQHKGNRDAPIYYVGRVKTDNFNARMDYHRKTRGLECAYFIDELTYEQARGIEEAGMLMHNTLKHVFPNNIIHGISPINPLRGLYLYDSLEYLQHSKEQALLEFFETFFRLYFSQKEKRI